MSPDYSHSSSSVHNANLEAIPAPYPLQRILDNPALLRIHRTRAVTNTHHAHRLQARKRPQGTLHAVTTKDLDPPHSRLLCRQPSFQPRPKRRIIVEPKHINSVSQQADFSVDLSADSQYAGFGVLFNRVLEEFCADIHGSDGDDVHPYPVPKLRG